MANSIFNTLSGSNQSQLSQFQYFMKEMKGKNPNEMIDQMLKSGRLSQAQLNEVQSKASMMKNQFEGLKNMFGF